MHLLNTGARSVLSGIALVASLLVGSFAFAPAASAWTPVGHCNTYSKVMYPSNFYSGNVVRIPMTYYDGGKNVKCWMDYGSAGDGVETLQLTLRTCYGMSDVAVDGDFGSITRSALIDVQGREGITPDGLYGEQTYRNLKWPRYTDGSRNGCAYTGY